MRVFKQACSLLCTLVFVATILTLSAYAASSKQPYSEGQFSDVKSTDWFAQYVQIACESGLMNGTSTSTFSPNANISVGEAIALSIRINTLFTGEVAEIATTNPWYQGHVKYALEKGFFIDGEFQTYTQNINRLEFATLLYKAIPKHQLLSINSFSSNSIPGAPADSVGNGVYNLYRTGILAGSDAAGTFNAAESIQRSEIATIVSRIINPLLRNFQSQIKTPQDLINCFHQTYGYTVVDTPYDSMHFRYSILENDMNDTPYDGWLQIEVTSGADTWRKIEHSLSLNDFDRLETVQLLRDLQKRVYYYFSIFFPKYKIMGGFYNSWYTYPNIQVDFQSCRVMTWKNYDGDSFNYYDNKITEFHWDSSIDDYTFPE